MNKHSCVEIEVCVGVSSIQNVILSSMFTSPGLIGKSCATYSDILYLNLTKDCQEFVQMMSWRSVNSSVTVSSSRL